MDTLPEEYRQQKVLGASGTQPKEKAPQFHETSLPNFDASPVDILPADGLCLETYIEQLENTLIMQALERTGNNKNQAAKLLGLNRTTLVERIKKRKLVPLNAPSKEL